jgi:hypothetical protein
MSFYIDRKFSYYCKLFLTSVVISFKSAHDKGQSLTVEVGNERSKQGEIQII